MTLFRHPYKGQTQTAQSPAVADFLISRGYVEYVPADDLKGADLDAALEAADLPKSGTVAEKRTRLTAFNRATDLAQTATLAHHGEPTDPSQTISPEGA